MRKIPIGEAREIFIDCSAFERWVDQAVAELAQPEPISENAQQLARALIERLTREKET